MSGIGWGKGCPTRGGEDAALRMAEAAGALNYSAGKCWVIPCAAHVAHGVCWEAGAKPVESWIHDRQKNQPRKTLAFQSLV